MWTKVTIPTTCAYVVDENNYSQTMWLMKVTFPTTCAYVVNESHYSHTTFTYLIIYCVVVLKATLMFIFGPNLETVTLDKAEQQNCFKNNSMHAVDYSLQVHIKQKLQRENHLIYLKEFYILESGGTAKWDDIVSQISNCAVWDDTCHGCDMPVLGRSSTVCLAAKHSLTFDLQYLLFYRV